MIDASGANPRRIYAIIEANEGGVFRSEDAGATWAKLGVGFPTAPVYSLAFRALTGTLVAATFGRSAWEIGFTPSLGATPAELAFEAEEGSDPAPQTLSLFDQEPHGSVLPVTAEPTRVRLSPDGSTALVLSDRAKVAWVIR